MTVVSFLPLMTPATAGAVLVPSLGPLTEPAEQRVVFTPRATSAAPQHGSVCPSGAPELALTQLTHLLKSMVFFFG